MIPEKLFNTGEITLNYAEGPASGPPLLLLHGLIETVCISQSKLIP